MPELLGTEGKDVSHSDTMRRHKSVQFKEVHEEILFLSDAERALRPLESIEEQEELEEVADSENLSATPLHAAFSDNCWRAMVG